MPEVRRIRGIPYGIGASLPGGLGFTYGNVFFVDSGDANASDDAGNSGRDPNSPFSTIDYAVGQCTANNGDVIFVLPGHVETVSAAAGLDLDVAGISVIGLGQGDTRPQINFTTVVGADMDVGAADITVFNVRFTGGFDALTGPIDVNAANFHLHNSIYEDVTGEVVDCIVTDANADDMVISSLIPGRYGWMHKGATGTGTQSGIQLNGCDGVVIQDFWADGNFAIGFIEGVTAAVTNVTIGGGIMPWYIRTRNAADDIINMAVASCTGVTLGPGAARLADDAVSTVTECITTNGTFVCGDNIFVCNADDERGIVWDGTASVG
jgi:hypothetical protein